MTKQLISGAVAFSLAPFAALDAFAQECAESIGASTRSSLRRSRIIRTCWTSWGSQSCVRAEAAIAESPNAANYDEAKANPYPELPEILKTATGETVDTAEAWWKKRRPEIVELLESEVYGRIPENVPGVKWEVRQTREVERVASRRFNRKLLASSTTRPAPRSKSTSRCR